MEIKLNKEEVKQVLTKYIRGFLNIPETHTIEVAFSTYGNEAEITVEPRKEEEDVRTAE